MSDGMPVLRRDHPTSRDVPTLICDSRAWVPASSYDDKSAALQRIADIACGYERFGEGVDPMPRILALALETGAADPRA